MSLHVQHLSHRYRGVVALDDVDFRLGPGVTALLGANGAGKSTLMSICAGLLPPTRGSVGVGGCDLYAVRTRRRALRQVAVMPQAMTFPPGLRVRDVVVYLTWLKGASRAVAARRAREAVVAVGLERHLDRRCGALSGGMLRRVALAQAMACAPEVLLLDEPSTGLDPTQRRVMVELVRALPGTVLMSSHVVEDVEDLADRIVVLDHGSVLFDGTTQDLAGTAPGDGRRSRVEAGFLHLTGGGADR